MFFIDEYQICFIHNLGTMKDNSGKLNFHFLCPADNRIKLKQKSPIIFMMRDLQVQNLENIIFQFFCSVF